MKNNFKIYLAVSLLLVSASNSNAQPWQQTGNTPVTAGTNIIGSVDPVNNVPILLYVNNSEKMRAWGNGNIGIGTTTSFPLDKLHVTGNNSGNNTRIAIENEANSNFGSYLMMDNTNNPSGDAWFVGSTGTSNAPGAAGFFEIWQGSTLSSRMVIDPNGQAGIATVAPTAKLHVECSNPINATNIRFENLQTYVGPKIPVLLIDDQGYVWKSQNFMANKHSSNSDGELESRVEELESQIRALTAQLNAFTGTLNTENTKINSADVLQVSPNPSNGNISISYNLEQVSGNASLIITDMTGKRIIERVITSNNGQMNITLPDSVASGILLCSIINGNNNVAIRQIVVGKK